MSYKKIVKEVKWWTTRSEHIATIHASYRKGPRTITLCHDISLSLHSGLWMKNPTESIIDIINRMQYDIIVNFKNY